MSLDWNGAIHVFEGSRYVADLCRVPSCTSAVLSVMCGPLRSLSVSIFAEIRCKTKCYLSTFNDAAGVGY